jgi:uncharacterized protein (TIGR03437 family)
VKKVFFVAVLALLCSAISALAQEGKGNGQLIFKLTKKTFSATSVSNGHRRTTAPAIVGAVETHWLIANEDLGPNAKSNEFDRVLVASYSGSFMFPGLMGSKAERKNMMAIARRFFRDSADVVEENSSDIKLAQAQSVSPSFPNDPMVPQQWYLGGPTGIGIQQSWTQASGLASVQTSSTTKVVVMDSGITPVSDLVQNLDKVNSKVFFGTGSPFEDPSTKAPLMTLYPQGHGTFVASIIGAVGNNGIDGAGIDWNANLVSYRIFNTVSTGPDTTTLSTTSEAVLKAFVALLDLPGNLVVNASFTMASDPSDPGGILWKNAITALGDRGLIVVAAGNDGSAMAQYPCSFGLPNVLCVGSTDQSGRLSSFSNHGDWVEVAAPGDGIPAMGNDGLFHNVSGTSFSDPMVSGVADLLWKAQPTLKSSELKQVIHGASFNPSLIGQIASARQLSYQGSLNALQNLVNGITTAVSAPIVLSALVPVWTDRPGLTWGGLASAYGDNFTDGAEFISDTPVTRLGNISVLVGTTPLPLTYVSKKQTNAQLPMDNWQFNQGSTVSVVKYDDSGNVISWSAIQGLTPVDYNPGFLTGPDGKLFLDTLDNGETVLYATGLGFTNPWVKAGTVGIGTEKVQAIVQVLLDSETVQSSTTASSRWAGVYEIRISTPSESATTLTVKVGDWQKQFLLK